MTPEDQQQRIEAFPTLPELLDYSEQNSGTILVRADVNGRLANYSLSELPASEAIHWVCEFIRRGKVPFKFIKRQRGV